MKIKIYQIDAFADKIFSGNPAAVCPLNEWLPDELLQNIAMENNGKVSKMTIILYKGSIFFTLIGIFLIL